jgi:hypothetical protein
MDFYTVLDAAIDLLRSRGRVAHRALKRQFDLDDDYLEDLKDALLYAYPVVNDGRGLLWTGETSPTPETLSPPVSVATPLPQDQGRKPVSYTPQHLAEKILTSRSALKGERKQVTVLFADIKDSTELIKDLDPEAAQQLLDPAIHIMMEAVHRFEGTVNQVLGDGIMALFGAPIAHEDHALTDRKFKGHFSPPRPSLASNPPPPAAAACSQHRRLPQHPAAAPWRWAKPTALSPVAGHARGCVAERFARHG